MDREERIAFGKYLRSLRDAKGYTQREAASMAKISGPYLAQLEKGHRDPPSREILRRLAAVYAVSESTLMKEADYAEGVRYGNVPAERIEWAFRSAIQDPDFALGTRMPAGEMTLETKAFILELYERSTGRNLLLEHEREALQQAESEGEDEAASKGAVG